MSADAEAAPVQIHTPEFKENAAECLAELRARGPVHRAQLASGLRVWAVVSHEAARQALTHPDLRKDPTPSREALAALGFTANLPGVGLGGNMLHADPPEHTRLRRLVAGAFSPSRTRQLAPRIQEIADGLLDAMESREEVDLVEAFTGPLPIAVIGELLGVPERLLPDFREWTAAALGSPSDHQRAGALNLNRFLAEVIGERRARRTGDLLSALVESQDTDDALSDEELIGTAVLLVVAGHETTVNLLGNIMVNLFRHPDQAALLRERPELVGPAVEEFLRYDTSVEHSTMRHAAADLDLAGTRILRGDTLVVMLGSANRDLAQPDGRDPDVLDVARAGARHLAFGYGIHHCLGAPLARLEATIAIGSLLRRFPGLRPAVALTELPWIPDGMMRGPLRLPVRVGPRA